MGLIDILDGALATALAGHGAQKEAKQFAASVEAGRTYYSVVSANRLGGPTRVLMEWTFTTPSRLTGLPMCGHMTAAGVWLNFGPIHADRPGRLKTFAELRNAPRFGPDPARALAGAGYVPAGV